MALSKPTLSLLLLSLLCLFPLSFSLLATSAATSLSRFITWRDTLTTLEGPTNGKYRAVHSSGGAAGGVVSEGQGYGVLMGGLLAATLPTTDAQYETVVTNTYEMFLAWRQMCILSANNGHCQTNGFYCKSGGNNYPCLPHWQFNDQITSASGTGPAPDGDEDAILGMILLIYGTEARKANYAWWTEVANWAYDSAKAVYDFETVDSDNGNWRLLKLGTCWGGWLCNNPSYHAPGAYRVFRNYMQRMQTLLNRGTEGTTYVAHWNKVITTSYRLIQGNQCPSTGLVTNWYNPSDTDPGQGDTSCSGSGTPADQYGSEASRLVHRVVLDYLWFADESSSLNYGPLQFSNKVALHAISKYTGGTAFSNLGIDSSCLVKSIHSDWTNNAFMYAPTLSALVVPLSPANSQQQCVLEAAGTMMKNGAINQYYSGSWLVLGTMLVNGDFGRVRPLVRQTSIPTSLPSLDPPSTPTSPIPSSCTATVNTPTPPTANTPPTVPPPPGVPPPTVSSSNCYYPAMNGTNLFWIEVLPIQTGVTVLCAGGQTISCGVESCCTDKLVCKPSGFECHWPRLVYINGACCPFDKACPSSPATSPTTNSVVPSPRPPSPATSPTTNSVQPPTTGTNIIPETGALSVAPLLLALVICLSLPFLF